MNQDVIIIGGGVLGVSLAYHLGQTGQQVMLFEREALPGMHASGKNAGMVRQLYRHPQLTDWAKRSIAGWPGMIRESCFRRRGSLIVGREVPEHHGELFEQRSHRLRHGQQEIELPAVYTAGDGLLDSPNYIQQLVRSCNKSVVQFSNRSEVVSLEPFGSEWIVETANGLRAKAPWIVIASGAWPNSLLQLLPELHIPAFPYARHLFLMSGWEPGYMPAANCGYFWEEQHGWYVREWDAHTRLVSICDRSAVQSPETFTPSPSIREELAEKLLDALPDVAGRLQLANAWHCFRTYTEDQLPVWGEDPQAPGLFWLAAFGGFGMSTSFAAAADAAQHITGSKRIEIADFSVSRFREIRSPKRRMFRS